MIFARLLFVFKCTFDSATYPFALVAPLDAPIGRLLKKDKDLGLYRVRGRRAKDSVFIPATSIIRGALLIPDPCTYGDYFVMDLIDSDWFLRCREIFRDRIHCSI